MQPLLHDYKCACGGFFADTVKLRTPMTEHYEQWGENE